MQHIYGPPKEIKLKSSFKATSVVLNGEKVYWLANKLEEFEVLMLKKKNNFLDINFIRKEWDALTSIITVILSQLDQKIAKYSFGI